MALAARNVACFCVLVLGGCSSPIVGGPDAGSDAGADAGRDAAEPRDAGLDAAVVSDVGTDTGMDVGPDSGAVDAGPCDLSAEFGPAVAVTGAGDVYDAEISEDELHLVFGCPGTGGVCESSRTTRTAPFPVGTPLGGTTSTFAPSMNEARTVLFVHGGAAVLVRYTRPTTGAAFTSDGTVVSDGTTPYVTESAVYYSAGSPTQIWFVSSTGGTLGPPTRVDSLVTGAAFSASPVLRADGREIAFQRNGDVWIASRSSPTGDFGTAVGVPTASPSVRPETPAGFSADGCRLYFSQEVGTVHPLFVVERP